MLDGTVLAWHEAITTGRTWDRARDAHRIRAAFVTLAQTRESWPQPRHFLEALPRVEQAALGYEVKPLSPAEAAQRLAAIRELLGEQTPTFRPATTQEAGAKARAEFEEELRRHYKDAAAGPDA